MNLRQILPSGAILGAASLFLSAVPAASAAPATRAAVTTPTRATVKPNFKTQDSTTTSAATVPVGFTTLAITPATDANNPTSQVVSVPFYQSSAYAAAVSSVDSTTQFSIATSAWTASAYAGSVPYLAHFKSGTSLGRYFLITANTARQLTVYTRGYDLSKTVSSGDTFEIVPANTLGSLYGTTSVPFQTGTNSASADNVYLWNGSNFDIYYYNGTIWKGVGYLGDQSSTIVYPDEGMFLVRRGTSALSLTFLGTVPSTTESSDVAGPASTFVSNRFPTDTTLTALGYQNLPNWLTGTSVGTSDNVYIWNGASWDTYYYTGSIWKAPGHLGDQSATAVPTGSAVFVVRRSSTSGVSPALVQTLPYTL